MGAPLLFVLAVAAVDVGLAGSVGGQGAGDYQGDVERWRSAGPDARYRRRLSRYFAAAVGGGLQFAAYGRSSYHFRLDVGVYATVAIVAWSSESVSHTLLLGGSAYSSILTQRRPTVPLERGFINRVGPLLGYEGDVSLWRDIWLSVTVTGHYAPKIDGGDASEVRLRVGMLFVL